MTLTHEEDKNIIGKLEGGANVSQVSVIMSCYKEPRQFLSQAIESILSQSFKDFEFIIILDDPTNKNLLRTLNGYSEKNPRVKILVQDKNRGLAAGRNKGIELASGKYVAMMDADDISLPNRLERQLEWIESHDCDLVFSHMEYISEKGENLGYFKPLVSKNPLKDLLLKPTFGHPTALIKREVFDSVKYDEGFKRAQDIDLWARLVLRRSKFCIVPEVLLKYRIHRGDIPIERIERQQGYAYYGIKFFEKHFTNFYGSISFWVFGMKKLIYFLLLYVTPKFILSWLMKLRDGLRE
jgi:hypothetical protein